MEMLQSLKFFLTYESLDEDFEQYDFESPLSYKHLQRKIVDKMHQKAERMA